MYGGRLDSNTCALRLIANWLHDLGIPNIDRRAIRDSCGNCCDHHTDCIFDPINPIYEAKDGKK